MSILQEYEQIDRSLVSEYGPNILTAREKYCNMIIDTYDQDTVANEYVLEADKERYFNNETVSKPLNSGHVFTGLTYDEKLWNKFIAWYNKNRVVRYSDELPYEKRRYWYFTTHGTGPGTMPKDLRLLDSQEGQNQKGTWGVFVCLDGVLNTSELREYDMIELDPNNVDR